MLVALGRRAEYFYSVRQRAVTRGSALKLVQQNFFIQVAETPGQRALRPVVSEMERGSSCCFSVMRHAPASRGTRAIFEL